MAAAERDKACTLHATRAQSRRTIPTDSDGTKYPDELDLYLNQLLDEALDETLPGGVAPSHRDIDKK